jgi:hypothetical protein
MRVNIAISDEDSYAHDDYESLIMMAGKDENSKPIIIKQSSMEREKDASHLPYLGARTLKTNED